MGDTLCVIDGYGLIYKCYYAFVAKPLINSKGENVSALAGFFNTLYHLLSENHLPLVVAMDSKVKTFRHDMYPQYKATRAKTPPDLYTQIDKIEEALRILGILVVRADKYEADDVIASIVKECRARGTKVSIFSHDKDLEQLVCDGVTVMKSQNGTLSILDEEAVLQEKGVAPKNILTLLSLMGDSADNIPGVKGVGEKTATKLVSTYGSLDAIYENIDTIKGVIKTRLLEGKEDAYFSQKLVSLRDDAPIPQAETLLAVPKLDFASLVRYFDECELRQQSRRWHARFCKESTADGATLHGDGMTAKDGAATSFGDGATLQGDGAAAVGDGTTSFDGKVAPLDKAASLWQNHGRNGGGGVSKDVPVAQWDFPVKTIDIASTFKADNLVAIPFALPPSKENFATLEHIIAEHSDDGALLVMVDAKSVFKAFAAYGFDVTRLLDNMGMVRVADVAIAQWMVLGGEDRASILATEMAASDSLDAFLATKWAALFAKLKEMRLLPLFFDVEMLLVAVLTKMELRGIHIDKKSLSEYGDEMTRNIDECEREIYTTVGHSFNIASPKQLATVLFEERALVPIKKTKTGYSTDNETLEKLAQKDEVARLVQSYRGMTKLRSTYIDALPKQTDELSRLHPTFLQTGTATGRLACQKPNLQNIPVRTDSGRKIRACFTPTDGNVFISADYSQIELVVLAHLCGDVSMCDAFKSGKDIHRSTASLIYGVQEDTVTDKMRRTAKTINFGILYGMSSFTLAKDLGISRAEAKHFIDAYFAQYPKVRSFMDSIIESAEATGHTQTIFGRIRKIDNINNPNKILREEAHRIAVNTTVQGSAADIVKKAMIDVERCLEGTGACVLLQVHDELIIECPAEKVDKVCDIVRDKMENVVKLSVPLRVSVSTGKNWGEL